MQADVPIRAWRVPGEITVHADGYRRVRMPDHPNAGAKGEVAEHTIVMTRHIGRPLHRGEFVHHVNGVRDDNRLANLELWSRAHPPGQRVADLVAWAREITALYGDNATPREGSQTQP